MGGTGDDESSGGSIGTGQQEDEGREEEEMFWKVPLPPECMHLVDSQDSDSFSRLLQALEESSMIAMDAEWKPLVHGSGSAAAGHTPRVAILQIACRSQRRKHAEDNELQSGVVRAVKPVQKSKSTRLRSVETLESELSLSRDSPLGAGDGARGTDVSGQDTQGDERVRNKTDANACHEMIFLLDLLALPASAFSVVLKRVFADPAVLKLGFGFKTDLLHLRGTFPGPDAHGCFDKVDPYLDLGKLYRHLHADKSTFMSRGRKIRIGGEHSLTSISERVLGLPLSKEMQCSNWEQRPLSKRQFDYAVADAYSLLMIFDSLQMEASESWFSPVVGDDNEDVLWNRSKVGVAGLLAPDNGEENGDGFGIAEKFTLDCICLPKRGDAKAMVKAALGEVGLSGTARDGPDEYGFKTNVTTGKTIGIETLVHRFGEKLLVSEGQDVASNRTRRKTRSRRARETGKNRELQDEQDCQYVGPPPWDEALGGDGIPKFLCDAMVEGLARQLRCVGIDAASPNSKKCEPRELVDLAEKEGRVILTRDAKLLQRKLVPTELAYRVKRQGKWEQLTEIIETFKLMIRKDQLLTRCTKCNGRFIQKALTAKEAAAQAPWNQVIPDCVLRDADEFWQCSTCKHLYWQGSIFSRAFDQFAAVCQTGKETVDRD